MRSVSRKDGSSDLSTRCYPQRIGSTIADPINLPPEFQDRIRSVFRERADPWLTTLPDLRARAEQRWHIRIGEPFPLSYNYVAAATRADGSEAVWKCGVPGDEARWEIEALRAYAGRGAVALIAANDAECSFLLERVRPGTRLLDLAATEKTAIAADVMLALRRDVPHGATLPHVADWARALADVRAMFNGATGPLPAPIFERAERWFAELLPSMGAPVLLHGDLHHENILLDARSDWLAIDPHGVVGEAEFEVGSWMRNPVRDIGGWRNLPATLARRLDIFGERLGFDRQRLLGWSLAQAVMSVSWTVLDGAGHWREGIAVAEALATLE